MDKRPTLRFQRILSWIINFLPCFLKWYNSNLIFFLLFEFIFSICVAEHFFLLNLRLFNCSQYPIIYNTLLCILHEVNVDLSRFSLFCYWLPGILSRDMILLKHLISHTTFLLLRFILYFRKLTPAVLIIKYSLANLYKINKISLADHLNTFLFIRLHLLGLYTFHY